MSTGGRITMFVLGPIRKSMKNKKGAPAEKYTMKQSTFEITQDMLINIPMNNIRFVHKLGKLVNHKGNIRTSFTLLQRINKTITIMQIELNKKSKVYEWD